MDDEIEYNIQVSFKGVGITVEYKQEVETQDLEQETETQFEIYFDRIIEYSNKADDNSGGEAAAFDWETDTVVKTLYLLEWTDFTPVQTDGIVSHFSVSTEGGVATFNFTVSQADYDEHVTANKMKIDFLLNDLSWKEQDDTYVALLSKVESERNVELDYDDGDHSMQSVMPKNAAISFQEATSILGAVPVGEFTWAKTAEARSESVNGTVNATVSVQAERVADLTSTIQVVATSPPIVAERQPGDKSSEFIAFSFIGKGARSASEIYWDPQAGVGLGPGSTSGVVPMSFGLSAVSGIVCAAVLFLV